MTDDASHFKAEDWVAIQKRYWDQWSDQLKEAFDVSASSREGEKQLRDAFDNWWQSFSDYLPEDDSGIFDRVAQHGKSFARVSEHLKHIIQISRDVNHEATDWQETMRARFNDLKRELENTPQDLAAIEGIQRLTGLPLDAWQHAMHESSLFGEDFLDASDRQAWSKGQKKLHSLMDVLLSIPAAGPDRERQEKQQRAAKLTLAYQQAMQAYSDAQLLLVASGLDRLCERLIERGEEQEEIKSLRELYDLWVDCGEEAYAEYVQTEEYAEVYGELANSSLRLKQHTQNEVEGLLAQFGIPGRKELDSALKKQHEMRQEIKALRFSVERAGKAEKELRDTIGQLKGEIEKLKSQVSVSARKVVKKTAEKKVAKKKVTKKKASKKKLPSSTKAEKKT